MLEEQTTDHPGGDGEPVPKEGSDQGTLLEEMAFELGLMDVRS